MVDFLENSVFFGVAISLLAYGAGTWLRKKTGLAVLNPLLVSVILVIAFLAVTKIDYQKYYAGAKYISYLLTPATVALAIPLYRQFELLKHNAAAILAGIISGAVTSMLCILAMALIFGFTHEEYVTFLPKSITTAIGMVVSEELGGYASITAAVIIITGIFGSIIGELVFKVFCITDPVARGVALGTSAHAIGTSKAMELGETEGAMSSLSIVICGLFTVVGAMIFANFI
ncbi:MAG: LrgB family protein [Ruminococcus sp.]|nr:LrgB family protein [Ruminococcus sp.]